MKIDNLKMRVAAFGLSATLALAPITAQATVKDFKVVYNEEKQEDELFYKVQEGDTASQISVYLVNRFMKNGEVPKEDMELFKEDPNTKCRFWPGVVYYYIMTKRAEGKNVSKFTASVGREIPVPGSYDELVALTAYSKKSGFHAKYCQANGIYPKPKLVYIDPEEAYEMMQEEFRYTSPDRNVEISPEMLKTALKMKSGPGVKFVLLEGAKLDSEGKFLKHELVLSPEEVEAEMEKGKGKQKTK